MWLGITYNKTMYIFIISTLVYVIAISLLLPYYIVHNQVHFKLTTLGTKRTNRVRPTCTCILSSCNVPTEKISRFVDHLQSLPSYLKGTTDFLLRLDTLGTLPPEAILVTPNVPFLYIPSSHKKRGFRRC